MNTHQLFNPEKRSKSLLVFLGCLAVLVAAAVLASLTQKSFGRVAVSNVTYPNFNAILIRAKLFKPLIASEAHPVPGIVYIHGYQNNRETSDAYCIELARRGFVVLAIDAIGRGNSGIPNDLQAPDFDKTFGGQSSLKYLKSLPFVEAKAVGLMGHSIGASIVYHMALKDPSVNALVISGFAYTMDATVTRPKNMLMIFGRYDEYRARMTGTRNFEKEWMRSERTRKVFGAGNLQPGKTYGDFTSCSARRVFIPPVTHLQESHNGAAIAEALEWMRQALHPPPQYWIPTGRQIWPIKEWATLTAMLACLASLLPLGLLLLRAPFFRSLQGPASGSYACSRATYFRLTTLNGLLMWLYLPLIFVLFGIHVYLVKIDRAFPLMMVNGIVWWFVWVNVIGFVIFRFWFKKRSRQTGLTLADLGLSYRQDRFALEKVQIAKTVLLASILFGFAFLSEYILEQILIVDFRFIFPFASDLTAYRAFLAVIYFPWLLLAFVLMGIFLHGQLCRPLKDSWLKTFISWSVSNTAALIIPLLLFLAVQYVPLFTTGFIPFTGPGGMFVSFVLNLFHIIGVLIMVIPISTWFYQLTGKIYLGAVLNAALVTWMFVSSQVIAPIPI
jgi:pimeloyl-ACP methyl ester carboxylesterase